MARSSALDRMFATRRERWLWIWALAVAAAIFGSLGFARSLAERFPSRELLDTAFFIAFVVAVVSVVILGLRHRARPWDIGVLLAAFSVFAMTFLRLGIPEERTHLIEYGILAVLIYEALRERTAHGRQICNPAVTAIVTVALLGWLDEGVQALLPDRVYDLRDVGFNALAALLAVAARGALARFRRT